DGLARLMGQAELTKVRARNPKISEAFAAVIEKALEVKPEDRFVNAQQFKEALLDSQRNRQASSTMIPSQPSTTRPNSILVDQDGTQQEKSLGFPHILFQRKWLQVPLWIWAFTLLLVGILAFSMLLRQYPPSVRAALATGVIRSATIQPTGTQVIAGMQIPTNVYVGQTQTPSPTTFISPTPLPNLILIDTPTPTISPTPFGGSFGQIVFASNRSGTNQIWLMNMDGSGLTQITNIPEGACQPNFSPNGMSLVFISPCPDDKETYPGSGMFIINVDGSNLTPLPNVPGGDYDPSWSPDGNWIVFTSLRITNRPRIYLMNVQTLEVKRLSEQFSWDYQPSWSPDGKSIVFVSRRQGPVDLWVMQSDGSNQQRLTLSGTKINASPKWSPDGNLIVYTQALEPGGVSRLAVFSNVEGKTVEYGFDLGPTPVRDPVFSPDGLWILFTSWPDGRNHDIYLIAANGAAKTRLTDFASKEFDPVWRPMVP
ncbi:MAG: hypothetical protein DDG59_08415, partial [Anaerolineae bacterium]